MIFLSNAITNDSLWQKLGSSIQYFKDFSIAASFFEKL